MSKFVNPAIAGSQSHAKKETWGIAWERHGRERRGTAMLVQISQRSARHDLQLRRLLCGKALPFRRAFVVTNLFRAESIGIYFPRPLGGEGGSQPAFSSVGARRVRGSELWRLARI